MDQDTGASATQTGLSQAEPVARLGPSGFDPLRDSMEVVVRQSRLIKDAAVKLGLRFPEEVELDAIYVLASGIHNRARRIVARARQGESAVAKPDAQGGAA